MNAVLPAKAPSPWRSSAFVLFWTGRSVSLTGSAVTSVALPLLAAVTLDAGPIGLGLLEACVWLPFLGLPLIAGVHLDRRRRRPVLLLCDVVRLILLTLAGVLGLSGTLSLPTLAILAFLAQSATVFSQIGEQVYLPSLVDGEQLLAANSAMGASRSAATLAGPGIAGLIVQVFGPPLALLVDAVSYLISLLTLGAIRQAEPSPEKAGNLQIITEIVEGLAFVWRTRQIRASALFGLLFNGFWQLMTVPFLLYALTDVRIAAGWWSLVWGCAGAGALFGSLLAPRLARRFGYGRTIVVASAGYLPLLIIPLTGHSSAVTIAGWATVLAVSGVTGGMVNVLILTVRTILTPNDLLGRVSASVRLIMYGGLPLGALTGGTLAHTFGHRSALWVGVIGVAGSAVTLLPFRNSPELNRPGFGGDGMSRVE